MRQEDSVLSVVVSCEVSFGFVLIFLTSGQALIFYLPASSLWTSYNKAAVFSVTFNISLYLWSRSHSGIVREVEIIWLDDSADTLLLGLKGCCWNVLATFKKRT